MQSLLDITTGETTEDAGEVKNKVVVVVVVVVFVVRFNAPATDD